MEGECMMNDKEKFEGFKQELVDENEQLYGDELREKFGGAVVDGSNAKLKGMTKEQHDAALKLCAEVNETLKQALENGNPASETAQKACALHKQWLCLFWPDDAYTKQAHRALGEMYVADERFKAHYDKIAPGAAEFLRDALNIYCAE